MADGKTSMQGTGLKGNQNMTRTEKLMITCDMCDEELVAKYEPYWRVKSSHYRCLPHKALGAPDKTKKLKTNNIPLSAEYLVSSRPDIGQFTSVLSLE
jgi:hypothetical protein